ncbi:DUF3455 domain-containing protein [Trinickia violacea]|uniref:DUF3455 domain-containing protein n=1 Tax=Trinickia violacea TaxID=2571746 RepID=A0A4P8IYJ6_9BURK|nr:DUF3455 domain-containing protein [Trinickia violacea]QCP52314.1 DUF3455 domain-containing protein [Trinickia violacea]
MNGFRTRAVFPVRRFAAVIGIGGMLALYGCATPPAPTPTANDSLPPNLRASGDEELQEVMTTHGDETYLCRRVPSDANATEAAAASTQLLWTQSGSEATLVDTSGTSAGTVAPNHYFLAYDGSYVIVNPAGESQVSANALTWARFTTRYIATPRPREGRFADVSSIQRIDTAGGLPPQPDCDLEGAHLLVPYSATYMIYRTKGSSPIALSASNPSTPAH